MIWGNNRILLIKKIFLKYVLFYSFYVKLLQKQKAFIRGWGGGMEEMFPTPLSKTKIFSTPHNVIKNQQRSTTKTGWDQNESGKLAKDRVWKTNKEDGQTNKQAWRAFSKRYSLIKADFWQHCLENDDHWIRIGSTTFICEQMRCRCLENVVPLRLWEARNVVQYL